MALVLPASVTVQTPATSANLGPGFDSLGLALQLYNRFEVEEGGDDPLHPLIEVQGALGSELSTGPDNLFFRSFALLFERQQATLPSVRIHMSISIPPGCGLGSSATAVVGGLVAANEWLREQGLALSKDDLLALAVEAEAGNHPDNVAPALLGGLVATTNVDVALLLTALQTGRYELIGEAMQDRLHQPYRQALFPAMPDIINAAIAAGAYGASLSGGGSSLIALTSSRFREVLQAMQKTAKAADVEGTGMVLRADQTGARVLKAPRGRIRKEVHARNVNQFYWSPAKPGSGRGE